MRWSGPWTIVGRTLVANKLLAGSASGKRRRGRPLNSVVRGHQMAASSDRTFADLLMILSAAPFLLWSLAFGAVWLGWQRLPDTTIGMIFFSFGVLAYLIVVFVGGGSAIWAARHAKSIALPLHAAS